MTSQTKLSDSELRELNKYAENLKKFYDQFEDQTDFASSSAMSQDTHKYPD